jgi:arylsulfatase
VCGDYDPFKAKWELYNLDKDFSQGNDMAKQNPAKLEELVTLWWAEARANNGLPIDWRGAERFSGEITGKPNLAGGRKRFVYPGNFTGLPESAAPDLKNKSFSVSAKADIKDGANGVIFTQGGNTGGWGFYMKDGRLVAAHNFIDVKNYIVRSDQPVPAGKHELKMSFNYEGGKEMGKSGTVTLFVDGKPAGSGKIEQTTPFKYSLSESQDIGSDTGTPVVYDYQGAFPFQGKLDEVVVELAN